MAVQEQTPYIEYTANGTTTSFALEFDCDNQNHLIVTLNGIDAPVGSWSLVGTSVVFTTAPLNSVVVAIKRYTPLERTTNYRLYDNSMHPEALNVDFDVIWQVLQELSLEQFFTKEKLQELLSQLVEGEINGLPTEILARIAGDSENLNLINSEALRAYAAEQALTSEVREKNIQLNTVIAGEIYRATTAETNLQTQVNAIGVGNKAYLTYAAMDADKASIPANSKVTVTSDSDISKRGDWQWNGAVFTQSPYDPLTQAKADATIKANAALASAKKYADDEKTSKKTVDQFGSTSVALQFSSQDDKDLGHINTDGSHFLSGEDESLQDQLKNRPKKIGDKTVAYSFDDSNNQSLLSITEDGCLYLAGDERSAQDQIFAAKSDGRIAVINDVKLSALSKTNADTAWLKKHNRISSSRDTTPNASNRIPAVVKIPTGVLIMYSERISPYDGDNQGARLMQRFVTIDSDYKVTSISAAQEVTRPSVDTGLTKHPMLCRAANNNLVLIYDERETTSTNYRQYVRTSSDNGTTWSSAVEIPQNAAANGQVCAVGSTGAMIVLGSGRIVCPMYTTNSIWMMYSDNNGSTWTHGAIASGTISGDSYSIAEPAITLDKNNEILVSVRSQKASFYKKLLYKSTDNGATTQFYRIADELISASCASSIFYDAENDLILHSTPSNAGAARNKYRLQYSTNNAANFIAAYRPFPETHYVGYSQIIKLASNTYLVVFEGDEYFQSVNSYENIATLVINTAEILNHVNYS